MPKTYQRCYKPIRPLTNPARSCRAVALRSEATLTAGFAPGLGRRIINQAAEFRAGGWAIADQLRPPEWRHPDAHARISRGSALRQARAQLPKTGCACMDVRSRGSAHRCGSASAIGGQPLPVSTLRSASIAAVSRYGLCALARHVDTGGRRISARVGVERVAGRAELTNAG
jgi:hypothetical protein